MSQKRYRPEHVEMGTFLNGMNISADRLQKSFSAVVPETHRPRSGNSRGCPGSRLRNITG